MADQKNAQPQQRGRKKSDKNKPAAEPRKRGAQNWTLERKAANVRRNLARQAREQARASQPKRTSRALWCDRLLRRVRVSLVTGATRNLAAAERRLNPEQEALVHRRPAPLVEAEDPRDALIRQMFGTAALEKFKAEQAKTGEAGD